MQPAAFGGIDDSLSGITRGTLQTKPE